MVALSIDDPLGRPLWKPAKRLNLKYPAANESRPCSTWRPKILSTVWIPPTKCSLRLPTFFTLWPTTNPLRIAFLAVHAPITRFSDPEVARPSCEVGCHADQEGKKRPSCARCDKYILVLRSISPLISSPHGYRAKIFLAMPSSYSPRHSQSRFTTPFPAAASNELHTVGGISQGDETSKTGNISDNKPATFGGVGVPEELVYESDLEEAWERPRRQRQGSLWTRGLAAVSPLFASSNKHNKSPVTSVPLLANKGNHSKLHPRWLKKPTRSCCILYCVVGFLAML